MPARRRSRSAPTSATRSTVTTTRDRPRVAGDLHRRVANANIALPAPSTPARPGQQRPRHLRRGEEPLQLRDLQPAARRREPDRRAQPHHGCRLRRRDGEPVARKSCSRPATRWSRRPTSCRSRCCSCCKADGALKAGAQAPAHAVDKRVKPGPAQASGRTCARNRETTWPRSPPPASAAASTSNRSSRSSWRSSGGRSTSCRRRRPGIEDAAVVVRQAARACCHAARRGGEARRSKPGKSPPPSRRIPPRSPPTAGAAAPVGSYGVTVTGARAGAVACQPERLRERHLGDRQRHADDRARQLEAPGKPASPPKAGATAVDVVAIGPDDEHARADPRQDQRRRCRRQASIVNDAERRAAVAASRRDSGAANGFTHRRDRRRRRRDDRCRRALRPGLRPIGASLTLNAGGANCAGASINGIEVASASNTLTDVVDGSRSTARRRPPRRPTSGRAGHRRVKKPSTTSSPPSTARHLLREQTKYDAASKAGGRCRATARPSACSTQLRSVLNDGSGASTVFTRLSDIGLEMQADGTHRGRSRASSTPRPANLAELRKLFATATRDAATTASCGATQGSRRRVLGSDGALTTASEGLNGRITRPKDREDALEARRRRRPRSSLRAQYTGARRADGAPERPVELRGAAARACWAIVRERRTKSRRPRRQAAISRSSRGASRSKTQVMHARR